MDRAEGARRNLVFLDSGTQQKLVSAERKFLELKGPKYVGVGMHACVRAKNARYAFQSLLANNWAQLIGRICPRR